MVFAAAIRWRLAHPGQQSILDCVRFPMLSKAFLRDIVPRHIDDGKRLLQAFQCWLLPPGRRPTEGEQFRKRAGFVADPLEYAIEWTANVLGMNADSKFSSADFLAAGVCFRAQLSVSHNAETGLSTPDLYLRALVDEGALTLPVSFTFEAQVAGTDTWEEVLQEDASFVSDPGKFPDMLGDRDPFELPLADFTTPGRCQYVAADGNIRLRCRVALMDPVLWS